MSKRMSPVHYWLCRAILLLDKVKLPMKWVQYHPPPRKAFWRWTKGVFGTNVLITRNWFFRFAREYEYRLAVKRSNGQERSS